MNPRIGCILIAPTMLAISMGAVQSAAQGGPPPTAVRVDTVQQQPLASRRLTTGDLRAPRRSLISSREPGLVLEVPIVEGQRVRQGDVLARLDTTLRQIGLEQLEADQYVAIARRDEQNAALTKLEQEAKRIRDSFERGAGYPRELEDIESDINVANARIAGAKRAIEVIDVRRRLLEQRIEDMEITAPFDGVVLSRDAEQGEWVAQGGAIAELIATDRIESWLRVPQEHFAFLAGGDQPIDIEIEATGEVYRATTYRVLPEVDGRSRAFTLIATLDNAAHTLAPGMSVLGWVPTSDVAEHLTVPKSAVREGDVGSYLFVIRESGDDPPRAVATRVEILFAMPDRLVVQSTELTPGDRVIVEGNERIFPGSPVTIINPVAVDAGDRADTGDDA